MARVTSMDEASILALFDAKRAEDLSVFGTQEDVADNAANIASQGIIIATSQADIAAAQASIASHGTTIGLHGGRLTAAEASIGVLNTGKPVRVSAETGGTVPANTTVGVGNLSLLRGSAVFNVSSNALVSKVPGLFVWDALYYMPAGGAQRQGFANPPDENGQHNQMNLESTTGADRETMAATTFFNAAGKAISFQWRSTETIGGCTFGLRGIFFPLFIDAA